MTSRVCFTRRARKVRMVNSAKQPERFSMLYNWHNFEKKKVNDNNCSWSTYQSCSWAWSIVFLSKAWIFSIISTSYKWKESKFAGCIEWGTWPWKFLCLAAHDTSRNIAILRICQWDLFYTFANKIYFQLVVKTVHKQQDIIEFTRNIDTIAHKHIWTKIEKHWLVAIGNQICWIHHNTLISVI